MIQLLKQVILENQRFIAGVELILRSSDLQPDVSYVICGPRRAGKSYRIYQFIQQNLIARGELERVVYINFEDERLLEMQSGNLDQILQAYAGLFAHSPVIFLDEIQRIEGWESFVRRLRDKHYQIIVTGSNAAMLSRDILSTLGGRLIVREQFPFSFEEFTRLRGIAHDAHPELSQAAGEVKRAFEDYFYYGGFPEVSKYEHSEEFLSNLYRFVVYGDLIVRNKIRNEHGLKLLIKKLAETVGDASSFRRIQRLINATGSELSVNSTVDYIGYLKDAYLVFPVQNFAKKFTERESVKKYYFVDNGILFLFQRNDSQLLENIVFLELMRRHPNNVTYLREKYEVDFYMPQHKWLIQVAHDMSNPETRNREIRALTYFAEKHSVERATIITRDHKENIRLENLEVEVTPAWKWLLASHSSF